jgi:hypothetical protein
MSQPVGNSCWESHHVVRAVRNGGKCQVARAIAKGLTLMVSSRQGSDRELAQKIKDRRNLSTLPFIGKLFRSTF